MALLKLIALIQTFQQWVPIAALVELAKTLAPLPKTDGEVDAWLDRVQPGVAKVLKHYLPDGGGLLVSAPAPASFEEMDAALEEAKVPAADRGFYMQIISTLAGTPV